MFRHTIRTLALIGFVGFAAFSFEAAQAKTTTENPPAFRVGSLAMPRLDSREFEFRAGRFYDEARAELRDAAHFGPDGVVHVTFELLRAVDVLDASTLADTDIFWAALPDPEQPISPEEQQALLDYVMLGGALILTGDVGPFAGGINSMAEPFGVQWSTEASNSGQVQISDFQHPISDGPFAHVFQFCQTVGGAIEDLGPHATEVAQIDSATHVASIARDALGPGSGPVLFFSDVNMFASNTGAFDCPQNRALYRNLFAYVAQRLDCRAGSVDASNGSPDDVLFVNGSSGGSDRILRIGEDTDFQILSVTLPPAGGNGKFVLHANLGNPSYASQSVLPFDVGSSCFPFLTSQGAAPVIIANNLGKTNALGSSHVFGEPVADPPRATTNLVYDNLAMGTVITWQALVIDPGSSGQKLASVTNAVTVRVDP